MEENIECLWKLKHLVMLVDCCFKEYIQDGIDWAKVEFEDNQDCLNLFEKVKNILVPPDSFTA